MKESLRVDFPFILLFLILGFLECKHKPDSLFSRHLNAFAVLSGCFRWIVAGFSVVHPNAPFPHNGVKCRMTSLSSALV